MSTSGKELNRKIGVFVAGTVLAISFASYAIPNRGPARAVSVIEEMEAPRSPAVIKVYVSYIQGRLKSGKDLLNASEVLVTSRQFPDILLAHDLAIWALAKGTPGAKYAIMATEDALLQSLGKPQRFGTQSVQDGDSRNPLPGSISASLSEDHRAAFGLPQRNDGAPRSLVVD